jgi:hypothetical protein
MLCKFTPVIRYSSAGPVYSTQSFYKSVCVSDLSSSYITTTSINRFLRAFNKIPYEELRVYQDRYGRLKCDIYKDHHWRVFCAITILNRKSCLYYSSTY